jgi:Collagen triple helix repeat (20 copies)
MFSRIWKRLTYTNVAMTLALVFAMSGGAYAAGKYLITSTKQISPKVLKALVGKHGPVGAMGAAGPAGAKGDAGPAGPGGAKGETGVAGPTGPAGPAGLKGAAGPQGPQGATGPQGPLQSGKSETGQWAFSQLMAEEANEVVFVELPFTIPLTSSLDREHVHYIGEGEGEGEGKQKLPEVNGEKLCSGNYKKPVAAKGNLCVFMQVGINAKTFTTISIPFGIDNAETGEEGAGVSGAFLSTGLSFKPGKGDVAGDGAWVVTAQ